MRSFLPAVCALLAPVMACHAPAVATRTAPLVPRTIDVLILGTFHFDQTDSLRYDVRQPQRAAELERVIDAIVRWNPDKVFVEWQPEFNQSRADSAISAARRGEPRPGRNEILRLAIPVAVRLGHPRVYCFDHPGRYGSLYRAMADAATALGQGDILSGTAPFTLRARYESGNVDSLQDHLTLPAFLRYLNAPDYQRTDHAHYLSRYPRIGTIRTDLADSTGQSRAGAELVADWYRRNVMMYGKVLKWMSFDERRIVLVVGNGHASILRHLFESHGGFRVTEVASVLPPR